MPAIDFPSAPANGASYSFGGKTWVYNGTGWVLQAASSSSIVLLGVTKVSANVSSVDFVGLFNGNLYDDYIVHGSGITPVADGLICFLTAESGSAFQTGATDYYYSRTNLGNGSASSAASMDAFIYGGFQQTASTSEAGLDFRMDLTNVHSATQRTRLAGFTRTRQNAGPSEPVITSIIQGFPGNISTTNALRVMFNSGQIAAGTIKLFGVRKGV